MGALGQGGRCTRRTALAGFISLLGAGPVARAMGAGHGSMHVGFADGRTTVDPAVNGFDPSTLVRDFDWGRVGRRRRQTVRQWELYASDKQIEVAPGVTFPAWTFNGRVPGPTLRCREGDLLRIHFVNASAHPHTVHFHGIHTDVMDG